MRKPYEAHLCAHDPRAWEDGFNQATEWIALADPCEVFRVYVAIRDSTEVPWPVTAQRLRVPSDAYHEGWALGVYGEVEASR